MKKLITTCVMLSAMAMVSFAQNTATSKLTTPSSPTPIKVNGTPAQLAEKRAKVIQTQLGLDATQYSGVYATELEYQNSAKMARDNGYEPGPGQSMQMKIHRDQRHKSVMTEAQYTKYESTLAND